MTKYDRPVVLPTLQWGAGGRQRALLLHGLSSSANTWWRVAGALAGAGYHVTAPDLRGHGDAPHTISYRLSGYAADLWRLGQDWDLVVGHSLGGTLAALTCARAGFAERVVLLDPVIIVPDDRFDDLLAAQLAELGDDEAACAERNPRWHHEDVALKTRAVRQTSRFVVERTLVDNRPWWYLDLLANVGVPTALLCADPAYGALFDATIGDEVARRNARITTRIVSGAGHSVHRDAPDAVIDVLLG